MIEAGNFGLVGDKPVGQDYTSLGARRLNRQELPEQRHLAGPVERGLGEAGTVLTFLPPEKIHNAIGWDDPESAHGVVDGRTAIPLDWSD